MSDLIPEKELDFNDLPLPIQAHLAYDAALDVVRTFGAILAALEERDDAWLQSALADCAAAVGSLTDGVLVAWICRFSEPINQARTAPFHWAPRPGERHHSWFPALYAVLRYCEEVIRPLLEGAWGQGWRPQGGDLETFPEGFLVTELRFEQGKFSPWVAPARPAAWAFPDERGLKETERAILDVLRAADEALQVPEIRRRLERLDRKSAVGEDRLRTLLRPGKPLRQGLWVVHVKGDGYRLGPRLDDSGAFD
jgi:hypothetical protein